MQTDEALNQLTARLPQALLSWYDGNARSMPWRSLATPYRTFVSEIMLQQTRVEAVTPYFLRFVEALPDVEALAGAGEDLLLKLWEGLGYYSRVRNMQQAARLMVERHGGCLPADVAALRALPGIGAYTAGAIASIAFGIRVAAVDGNVLRVFARLLCSTLDIASPSGKRTLSAAVERVLPQARVGDFNQALMELGATVCLPNGRPLCLVCPAAVLCLARAAGRQEELPIKVPKKARRQQGRTVLILSDGRGRIALQKRPMTGLLAGLWEPVTLDGMLDAAALEALLAQWGLSGKPTPLADARHVFTHVEWRMKGWRVEVTEGELQALECALGVLCWATPEQLARDYAHPAAYDAYLGQRDG